MSTAKLTISSEQAAKIGLLVYHKKPVYNILYDAVSGVNLYETGVGETIDVPDGANISRLQSLQSDGLFTVKEGTILAKAAAFDSASYDAETGLLTLTFDAAVTSSEMTSTANGEAGDDIVVEANGTYYAGTFAAVSEETTITATITTGIDTDVVVTINQAGASKIYDANNSAIDPTDNTVSIVSSIATVSSATYTVAEAAAAGILTLTGAVSDGETVTIGTDVYEFDTDSTVTQGNIQVDVNADQTAPAAITALVAAITASDTVGVGAADGAGDTVDLTADNTGPAGNLIATTETMANGSFGAVTLEGGDVGTITNVPAATAKADFLAALTKDEPEQTWVDTGVDDPVVSTNTLEVTAEDASTMVTYTITVT